MEIEALNRNFTDKSPKEIIAWCVAQDKRIVLTTHFGPFEAVMLHMVSQIKPDIQVLWVDSGYNTKATYRFAKYLSDVLALRVDVFTPKISAARQDAAFASIPLHTEPGHVAFTENFKLEPFRRAMAVYNPAIWLTALRKEQTEFRQSLNIFTKSPEGKTNKEEPLKVAPLFHWTAAQMQAYLIEHNLPNEENYYDPTKALENRECGLHTGASQ